MLRQGRAAFRVESDSLAPGCSGRPLAVWLHRQAGGHGWGAMTTDNFQLSVTSHGAIAALQPVAERARQYAARARAPSTLRAYERQWRAFEAWCAEHGVRSMPALPAAVALYLTERADSGWSVATLAQALVAISRRHDAAGEPSPRVDPGLRDVWKGIKNTKGVAPQREASPLGPDELRRMIGAGRGVAAVRDRALMLLGFAGARRRIELVNLNAEDVRDDPDGLIITIRRSKTDQEGAGFEVPIPFGSDRVSCPVRGLKDWLQVSGIDSGAIFRSIRRGDRLTSKRLTGRDVARIIQRAAKRAGIKRENLSGHSLRSGFVTTAHKAGKSIAAIQKQTGHKTIGMVVRYVRKAGLFDSCAAAGIGL